MGKTMYCYGMPLLSPAPSREWCSRAKAQNVPEERDTRRGEKCGGRGGKQKKEHKIYRAGEVMRGKRDHRQIYNTLSVFLKDTLTSVGGHILNLLVT